MTTAIVKDIKPNPFRHLERYPIQREKVEALRESLRSTTYWGNLLVRRLPDGTIELAFGHHRLVALREEFGPNAEIELIERDLDDDAMLQIMARENMTEWATTASVEHETVRATVEAFAAGRIHLPEPPLNANVLRYAPSFVVAAPGGADERDHKRRYTVQSVAEFLGWVAPGVKGTAQNKVGDALAALELMEEGLLSEADFAGLSTSQASALVMEARKAKAKRDTDAKIAERQAEEQRKRREKAEREAEEQRKRKEEAAKREAERRDAAEKAAQAARVRAEEEREAREAERKARAAKQAEEAEKQRKAAEAKKAEAAKQTEVARKAEIERKAAEEQRQQAEQAEVAARQTAHNAEVQRKRETAQADAKRTEGRQAAAHVGKAVGREMRSGKIGYRQAAEVAQRVDPRPPKDNGLPKNFKELVAKLLSETFKKVFGDDDPRLKQWLVVVKYRAHLTPYERKNAAATLRGVGQRFINIANQIED